MIPLDGGSGQTVDLIAAGRYDNLESHRRTKTALQVWEHILDTNFGTGTECLNLFDRTHMIIYDKRFTLCEARNLAINIAPCVLTVIDALDNEMVKKYNYERHVVPFIFGTLCPVLNDLKELASGSLKTVSVSDADLIARKVSIKLQQL